MKSKKNRKNKNKKLEIYKTKSNSVGILFFQRLINKDPTGKTWIRFLNEREVRFIYDMVASTESFKNFTPTTAQSKKIVFLVNKIKLINNKKSQKK